MATQTKHDNLGACRKRSVPATETLDDTVLHESITRTLERRYGGRATHDELARIAATAIEHYRSAAVTNFVPILAQRTAQELATRHIAHQDRAQAAPHTEAGPQPAEPAKAVPEPEPPTGCNIITCPTDRRKRQR